MIKLMTFLGILLLFSNSFAEPNKEIVVRLNDYITSYCVDAPESLSPGKLRQNASQSQLAEKRVIDSICKVKKSPEETLVAFYRVDDSWSAIRKIDPEDVSSVLAKDQYNRIAYDLTSEIQSGLGSMGSIFNPEKKMKNQEILNLLRSYISEAKKQNALARSPL